MFFCKYMVNIFCYQSCTVLWPYHMIWHKAAVSTCILDASLDTNETRNGWMWMNNFKTKFKCMQSFYNYIGFIEQTHPSAHLERGELYTVYMICTCTYICKQYYALPGWKSRHCKIDGFICLWTVEHLQIVYEL